VAFAPLRRAGSYPGLRSGSLLMISRTRRSVSC
jgi:hypothetical protein